YDACPTPREGTSMRRLFVANRGEIAVRIIRTARELGIETVLGYSSADRDSLARQLADDAFLVAYFVLALYVLVRLAVKVSCDDAPLRFRGRDCRRLDEAATRRGPLQPGDRPTADLDRAPGRRAAGEDGHGEWLASTRRLRGAGAPPQVRTGSAHPDRGRPATPDFPIGDDRQAGPARAAGIDRASARSRRPQSDSSRSDRCRPTADRRRLHHERHHVPVDAQPTDVGGGEDLRGAAREGPDPTGRPHRQARTLVVRVAPTNGVG